MKQRYLLVGTILFAVVLVGCARQPTMEDVKAYGEKRFIAELLAVKDGKAIPNEMRKAFRPIRAEAHLNGAWLVIRESTRFQSGIYVDEKSVDGWGGSGMEVTRWSDRICWTREKNRP